MHIDDLRRILLLTSKIIAIDEQGKASAKEIEQLARKLKTFDKLSILEFGTWLDDHLMSTPEVVPLIQEKPTHVRVEQLLCLDGEALMSELKNSSVSKNMSRNSQSAL